MVLRCPVLLGLMLPLREPKLLFLISTASYFLNILITLQFIKEIFM